MAPPEATCVLGEGRTYDFFVVSKDIAVLVGAVRAVLDSPQYPHRPCLMELKRYGPNAEFQVQAKPRRFPLVRANGPMMEDDTTWTWADGGKPINPEDGMNEWFDKAERRLCSLCHIPAADKEQFCGRGKGFQTETLTLDQLCKQPGYYRFKPDTHAWIGLLSMATAADNAWRALEAKAWHTAQPSSAADGIALLRRYGRTAEGRPKWDFFQSTIRRLRRKMQAIAREILTDGTLGGATHRKMGTASTAAAEQPAHGEVQAPLIGTDDSGAVGALQAVKAISAATPADPRVAADISDDLGDGGSTPRCSDEQSSGTVARKDRSSKRPDRAKAPPT